MEPETGRLSQEAIITSDILIEFLEAAFYQIIYYRKLYPETIFMQKKLYGTRIFVSIHPDLNEYIKNVLLSVQELLKDISSVNSIQMIFFNKDQKPIEKFVFNLIDLKTSDEEKDAYFIKTEEALRTICLKLSMLESYLKPLPEDSTFRIIVTVLESSHIGLSENENFSHFPWILQEEPIEMKNGELLPLKTVKTEALNLEMYAIEDKHSKRSKSEREK